MMAAAHSSKRDSLLRTRTKAQAPRRKAMSATDEIRPSPIGTRAVTMLL
jgi:hypothetical protein